MPKPIRRIGASKLATVSECQTPQGTHIALKEYNRQPLTKFQHERIFSAAQRWQTLNIPGLVPYLEVSPERNEVAMELFDRSAAIRLSEGHSDPRLVLHALRGILAALGLLHEQGLLHVNLKPTNVFFDANGRARLSDGLLISATSPTTLPPPTNQKYLTPEHTSDAFGPMTSATDLYTVGFMALELLAGDRFGRAFQGIGDDAADDDLAWFQWHGSSQEAPPANLFSKTCPAELAAVIARLVAKQPSARYSSARQAFDELPQDITVQSKSPALLVPVQVKREALSTDVIERPATGIVLAVASGSRAGEMIGTNENELMIGFDHDCFLRFSNDQYPLGGGKVLMRRGPQGWYVLRVSGDTAFVNQHLLEEKAPLRSGDIVRLSSRGPDVQFTMQSGGVAVRSLVARFLPSQSHVPRSPSSSTSPSLAPNLGGQSPSSPVARPVLDAAPTRAVAPSPSAPSSPATPQSARASGVPLAPAARSAPTAPSRPSPALAGPSAPLQPNVAASRKDSGKKEAGKKKERLFPAKASKSSPSTTAQGTVFSWTDPKTWSKNQTNTVIAVVGGILVVIAVLLFPTAPAPKGVDQGSGARNAPDNVSGEGLGQADTNETEAPSSDTPVNQSAPSTPGVGSNVEAATDTDDSQDIEATALTVETK